MMAGPQVLDIYGVLDDITISVTQNPRQACVDFMLAGKSHSFRFENPEPLTSLMYFLDECCNVRIIDRNLEMPSWLEFGRYRVELWDEDDSITDFTVDGFEHLEANGTA
jgi:hypothetical protein